MKDSFKGLQKHDSDNQLEHLENWSNLFSKAYKKANRLQVRFQEKLDVNKLLICGMGGSGISGKIIEDIFKLSSSFIALSNNNYSVPLFVDDKTLVIVISYSGNTEETITAFNDSLRRHASVIAITSNGQLKEVAQKMNIPTFQVEKGYQPRFGFPLLLGTVLGALNKVNLLPFSIEIDQLTQNLQLYGEQLQFSVPIAKNQAKKVAMQLHDTIPFIVSNWESIAHRTKSQLNENAKMFAFGETYPELFHNSVSSWLIKERCALAILDLFINEGKSCERLQEKMQFLIKESNSFQSKNSIEFSGSTILEKFLKAIIFGDFVSYYAALLNKEDPSTIEMIKKLKSI